jgi:hypothetical protein
MAAIVAVLAGGGLVACEPAAPAPLVIGPSDSSTVPDPGQVTGRRVALPMPDCAARTSDCNEIRLINQLDGFDLDPRVSVRFSGPFDVRRVTRATLYLHRIGDTTATGRIGLRRLVVGGSTLYGQPAIQLREATRYEIVVTSGINGQAGRTTFTTMTATRELRAMVGQIDSGQAYAAAGVPSAQRGLDFVIGGERRVYPAANVVRPRRFEDLAVGSADPLVEETVFDSSPASLGAGTVAFGSFLSPQWIGADRTIPRRPSRQSPVLPSAAARVGFVLLVPRATALHPKPAGGWPVAVFGPGVTRSKYDVFLAADENLRNGIATMAIDPVGHAYGPASQSGVDLAVPPTTERFSGFGRAIDVEGDGTYGNRDGLGTRSQPAPKASVALRDGLRQTALDDIALVRAIARGADVDGDGHVDLRPTGISWVAQSLGGIYGTMLMAADPSVRVGVLNVPGGPILEIARLSPGFRCDVTTELGRRVPSILNGGESGCDDARMGFTESAPLYADPPVTAPAPGALVIQAVGARTNWIDRSGSPEAFAPLLRLRPPAGQGAKKVLYQFAYGDQTVPNPTSSTLMRAGHLRRVTTVYRNDLTPTAGSDPHGFLIDPRLTGRQMALVQVASFLSSGGATIVDPDGAGPVFEVPIADKAELERLNF